MLRHEPVCGHATNSEPTQYGHQFNHLRKWSISKPNLPIVCGVLSQKAYVLNIVDCFYLMGLIPILAHGLHRAM